MAENQVLTSAGEEKELSELLQIRRDKLSALVEAGQNPFEQHTVCLRNFYAICRKI